MHRRPARFCTCLAGRASALPGRPSQLPAVAGREGPFFGHFVAALLTPLLALAATASPAPAATPGGSAMPGTGPVVVPSYADLADLADHATIVVRLKPGPAAQVEPERAPGLAPGQARLYVEGRAVTLLAGHPLTGDSLRYLVDVPLDSRGKPPRRTKGDVIVFARAVPAHPGQLQLVAPDAQLPWSVDTESRVKAILGELLAADAPPPVSSVREAIHVPGTLAGEGETQLFLATANGEPASITVAHRPGESPRWSVSFSEVLDTGGAPPARETLAWYRLACFLPPRLAASAHVSASPADRAQAEIDYQFVRAGLGDCPRTRR